MLELASLVENVLFLKATPISGKLTQRMPVVSSASLELQSEKDLHYTLVTHPTVHLPPHDDIRLDPCLVGIIRTVETYDGARQTESRSAGNYQILQKV